MANITIKRNVAFVESSMTLEQVKKLAKYRPESLKLKDEKGNPTFIVGTTIGTAATLVPLVIGVAPFIARLVETSLREVDRGLIEAAQSMGATNMQIINKVLLPEAMPGIVAGVTIAIVTLVGYSAMAGAIGGGGLGDLAIRYGYQRFRPSYLVAAVIIILIMVEIIQVAGDMIVKKMMSKR